MAPNMTQGTVRNWWTVLPGWLTIIWQTTRNSSLRNKKLSYRWQTARRV